MGKCRYDLSEDCHKKDCLDCVLDKIRAEIEQRMDGYEHITKDAVFAIIDKYRKEQE